VALTLPAKSNIIDIEDRVRKALEPIPEVKDDKVQVLLTDYNGDTIKMEIHCYIDNSIDNGYNNTRDKIIRKVHEAIMPPPEPSH
jgi:small-conductance mechanosensitive channel